MFRFARSAFGILEKVSARGVCRQWVREIPQYRRLIKLCSLLSSKSDDQNTVVGALLKPHPASPIPDASPFFLRQYIKGHHADMFELYPQLLTEIVLRLPYQIQKHASIQATFEQVRCGGINVIG